MEFRNCDSNDDKVRLYESVRKSLAEKYEDEPETFSSALVSENPYKDLDDVNEIDWKEYQVKVETEKKQTKRRYSPVQERIKNLRQIFSEAVTAGRRNGSGQIKIDYYDEIVKIWGGSPASEPLSYGISTTSVNDNINADNFSDKPNNSSGNSLSTITPSTYSRLLYFNPGWNENLHKINP